jgi:hypothetical protein
VEGDTEKSLPAFISRWLAAKIQDNVQVRPVNFHGVGNYRNEFARRARRDLQSPEIVGIVGVIDFYRSSLPYPTGSVDEKCAWAKRQLEAQVSSQRFRQHFAVHETEAWLLSAPGIFPAAIQSGLPQASNPETVNTTHPPSEHLKRLYRSNLNRTYGKSLEGAHLFSKLNPETAYERCPHLRLLLDDVLALATAG